MTSRIDRFDQNTLVSIMSFADNTHATSVCRSFCRAMQEAMRRVACEIALTQNVVVQNHDWDEDAPEKLQNLCERRSVQVEEEIVTRESEFSKRSLRALWGKILELKEAALQEPVEGVRRARICRLLSFLEGRLNLENAEGRLRGKALVEEMEKFIASERTADIFCEITRHEAQMSSAQRLAALHAWQKEAVAFDGMYRQLFSMRGDLERGHFSRKRFIAQAELVTYAEQRKDGDMFIFWEEIWRRFTGLGINVVNIPRTAAEIRAWLRAPVNSAALDQVTALRFYYLHHLPPEIGRLRNLESLTCIGGFPFGQLSTLPQELGELRNLTRLDLERNEFDTIPPVVCQLESLTVLRCNGNRLQDLPEEITQIDHLGYISLCNTNFLTIPEVISRMPHLSLIELSNAQVHELPDFLTRHQNRPDIGLVGNPIPVLPDAIFRHNEHFLSFFHEDLLQIAHLNLTRENLTQIPFRLWFKENVRIPSIPYLDWHPADPANFLDCIRFGINIQIVFLNYLPIFLINLLLYEVVEPVVTFVRDRLGYDRLVRV